MTCAATCCSYLWAWWPCSHLALPHGLYRRPAPVRRLLHYCCLQGLIAGPKREQLRAAHNLPPEPCGACMGGATAAWQLLPLCAALAVPRFAHHTSFLQGRGALPAWRLTPPLHPCARRLLRAHLLWPLRCGPGGPHHQGQPPRCMHPAECIRVLAQPAWPSREASRWLSASRLLAVTLPIPLRRWKRRALIAPPASALLCLPQKYGAKPAQAAFVTAPMTAPPPQQAMS